MNVFVEYREQDFQLLEALAKRMLTINKDKEENEESFFLTSFDSERLTKLEAMCKRLKHYNSIEKLLSTMFTRVLDFLVSKTKVNFYFSLG